MPVVNYIWDVVSDNVLMEVDDEGNTLARYVQEPGLYGEAISQERDGETRYYNYDGLGNTVELTDENENVTDTYEYSAFGEEVARTGTIGNPFGYKGALGYYTNGETGDIYVRARTYEPSNGRWLSADPLNFVDELNRYVYSRNSPLSFADPTGLIWTPGYGKYCGPRNGPGIPIDPLDTACQVHDNCLATWRQWINPCTLIKCDIALCAAARDALRTACAGTPPGNELNCIIAAQAIETYACRWVVPLYTW